MYNTALTPYNNNNNNNNKPCVFGVVIMLKAKDFYSQTFPQRCTLSITICLDSCYICLDLLYILYSTWLIFISRYSLFLNMSQSVCNSCLSASVTEIGSGITRDESFTEGDWMTVIHRNMQVCFSSALPLVPLSMNLLFTLSYPWDFLSLVVAPCLMVSSISLAFTISIKKMLS